MIKEGGGGMETIKNGTDKWSDFAADTFTHTTEVPHFPLLHEAVQELRREPRLDIRVRVAKLVKTFGSTRRRLHTERDRYVKKKKIQGQILSKLEYGPEHVRGDSLQLYTLQHLSRISRAPI
jgi:hypothetical protein